MLGAGGYSEFFESSGIFRAVSGSGEAAALSLLLGAFSEFTLLPQLVKADNATVKKTNKVKFIKALFIKNLSYPYPAILT